MNASPDKHKASGRQSSLESISRKKVGPGGKLPSLVPDIFSERKSFESGSNKVDIQSVNEILYFNKLNQKYHQRKMKRIMESKNVSNDSLSNQARYSKYEMRNKIHANHKKKLSKTSIEPLISIET